MKGKETGNRMKWKMYKEMKDSKTSGNPSHRIKISSELWLLLLSGKKYVIFNIPSPFTSKANYSIAK